jgi:hypothetical protein
MDRPRPKSRLAPAMIVAGAILAVFLFYALGYFLGSEVSPLSPLGIANNKKPYRLRTFDGKWQCALYAPAAWIESVALGVRILPCYEVDGKPIFYPDT